MSKSRPTSPGPVTHNAPLSNRKPLIAYASNRWPNEHKSLQFPENPRRPSLTRSLLPSRRLRRMLAALLLLFSAAGLFYLWTRYLQPHLSLSQLYASGFLPSNLRNGTYGLAHGGPRFSGPFIQDLDPALVPGGHADPHGRRRLIFVGDVHGCREELDHLLQTLDFVPATDHLILTGDVVSKGPDSNGVLDRLIELGATSVRGNHEDRLLAAAPGVLGAEAEGREAVKGSFGAERDAEFLRGLGTARMRFLRDMPLILRVPALPHAEGKKALVEEVLVVHAGLVPGVPLRRQDPHFVMNMRTIHGRTHVPSTLPVGAGKGKGKHGKGWVPWVDLWGWYSGKLAKGRAMKGFEESAETDMLEVETITTTESGWKGWWDKVWADGKKGPRPQVIVYGHDSRRGLQLKRWTKGLDSACVRGGELTALVLDAKGKQKIVSVRCKDHVG